MEESARYFQEASRISPDQSLYLYNLGILRYLLSQYPEAIESYEKAIKLDPNSPIYYANLADALSANKEWERALATIERVKELDNDLYIRKLPALYNARGNDYYNQGYYASSLHDYQRAVELDPGIAVYHANVAVAFTGLKQWEPAFEAVKKAKDLDTTYVQAMADVYNSRGNDYYRNGDYARALKDYEKAVEHVPGTGVYHANIAAAFAGLKEWERAFKAVEKAKDLDRAMYAQGLALVYNARGNESTAKGDYASSLKDYQQAVEHDPKGIVYHANVAFAFTGLKDWDSAFATVEKAKELNIAMYPQNLAMVYNARGNEANAKGDYASSLKDYQQAVELDPTAVVYHANVAFAFTRLKDWDSAFATVEKAKELNIAIYPQNLAMVYNARGNEAKARGDYAASLKDYEKAVELDPKAAGYYGNVAFAFAGLKDWEHALTAMEKAKELDHSYARALADIYNSRGTQYYADGDYGSSLKDYQKAIELDDESALYHRNLSMALRELGDWERAISACTRAIELEPTNADSHRALKLAYNAQGIELLNKGEYKQAIKKFRESIQAQDGDDIIYHNLGLALEGSGDIENAVKALQEAIRLNPTNDEYKKVLEQIASHVQS